MLFHMCMHYILTGYDFLRLYATGTDHTGIVYTSQQTSIGDIIRELMPIYQVPDTEEMPCCAAEQSR